MFRAIVISLIMLALPAAAGAAAPEPVRVLYLSQSVGFVHETVRRSADGGPAPSEIALDAMAQDSDAFTVTTTQDARDLTPARLNEIDVLVVSTTGALPIDRPTWDALLAWVESGRGGVVGIHSAADTQLDFEGGREAWTDFIGGQFESHPWTQGTPIRLRNLDPSNPLAAMWPDGTDYAEEIYQYTGFRPDTVRVLQSLDMAVGPIRRPYSVPVTWTKQIGQGRLFYTNLGHTPSTWDDPRFRTQITGAILWAARRSEADATPNPEWQDHDAVVAFAAAEGVALSDVRPMDIAPSIRALPHLHPDQQRGDAQAWNEARQRIARRLQVSLD